MVESPGSVLSPAVANAATGNMVMSKLSANNHDMTFFFTSNAPFSHRYCKVYQSITGNRPASFDSPKSSACLFILWPLTALRIKIPVVVPMAEFVSTYVGNKFTHPAFIETSVISSDGFYHTPPRKSRPYLNYFYYFEEWQNRFLCRKPVTIPQCIDIFPSTNDKLLILSVLCCFSFIYDVLYLLCSECWRNITFPCRISQFTFAAI